MGLWQHLVVSYDKNADALKKTYPLSTTSISNNSDIIAIIVIDGNGKFVRFDKIAKKSKPTKNSPGNSLVYVTIPASEESLKRTSTAILPYPVFEEFSYLRGLSGGSDKQIKELYEYCAHVRKKIKELKADNKNVTNNPLKRWESHEKKIKIIERYGRKYDAYIFQLRDFSESAFATEQIKAIYQYVSKGTINSDLLNWNKKKLKKPINIKDKTNIIFQVEIPGNSQTQTWEDGDLFSAWHQYYVGQKRVLAERKKRAEDELICKKKLPADEKKKLKEDTKLNDRVALDYVTGVEQLTATSHPKKISNASGNAKLVSDNDKTNYTFRGKFSDSSEVVSIGYETSQKAHQFLRYLIKDRGYGCGEQVILSFTIGSTEKLLTPPIEDKSIWSTLQNNSLQTESDIQIDLCAETGFDYGEALRRSLGGFGLGLALKQHAKTVVVALDAATTGRLSITFYRELDRNEYLEKIADWHDGCKWYQRFRVKVKEKYVSYIGAPSVDKIIEAVHGKPRGDKDESYTKIKKGARERLLRCIFDGTFLPIDYVVAAIRRASNPLGITRNGKFDRSSFDQVLSTACALVRKDCQKRNKEGYKLNLELDRTDRDYLYGRLLGAADKLEEYALYKKDKGRVVTASIRHMQTFAQHPFRTWQTIHNCLNPYIQTVKGGFAFNEIQAVMNQFAFGDYQNDEPLNGLYLIGYYHERAYIDSLVKAASKKSQSTDHKEQESNNEEQ